MAQRKVPQFESAPLPVEPGEKTASEHFGLQDELAVTFRKGGRRTATLKDHHTPSIPTLSLDELTPEQWRTITVQRIRAQSSFKCITSIDRVLTRTAAVREVKLGTITGNILVEIEQSLVRAMVSSRSMIDSVDFVSQGNAEGRTAEKYTSPKKTKRAKVRTMGRKGAK